MKKADAWNIETHFREKVIGNFSVMGLQGALDHHRHTDDLGVIMKSGIRRNNYKNWVRDGLTGECGLDWLPECFKDMAYGSILMLMRCGYTFKQISEAASKVPKKYKSDLSAFETGFCWQPGVIFQIDLKQLFSGSCSLPDQDGLFDSKIDIQSLLNAINEEPLKARLVLFPPDGFLYPYSRAEGLYSDHIKKLINRFEEIRLFCTPEYATLSQTAFLFFSNFAGHSYANGRMLPAPESHRSKRNVFIRTETFCETTETKAWHEIVLFTCHHELNHNKATICFKKHYETRNSPFEYYGLPLMVIN
ncbi:MAG: hypothetical protein V1867_05200 [Candidatus Falkowbacteria bacterium]